MAARTLTDAQKKAHQDLFCAAYEEMGVVTYACKAADIGRSTVYQWRDEDPEFAARMAQARESAIDRLEQEATRRAVEGTTKPVFQGGKEVGHLTEYSDTLLIFLLKGARPERFRDRYIPADTGEATPGASPKVLDRLTEAFEQYATAREADAYLAGRADAEDEQPATS